LPSTSASRDIRCQKRSSGPGNIWCVRVLIQRLIQSSKRLTGMKEGC